jgi:flagellar hook-basal body complex protein FliE
MSVGPISSVGGVAGIESLSSIRDTEKPAGGFSQKVSGALQATSDSQRNADVLAQDVATGGPTSVEELMVATTQATLTTEMLVQVRNRAIEAYQEVMRMQI